MVEQRDDGVGGGPTGALGLIQNAALTSPLLGGEKNGQQQQEECLVTKKNELKEGNIRVPAESRGSGRSRFAPLRKRWMSILIASLLPCGVHISQQIDALKPYFSKDPVWDPPVDGFLWGLLQTTYTGPNLVFPCLQDCLQHVHRSSFMILSR